MDGLLVIDKPEGPTSHDVVARVRRLFREPRVGHTGTLDPMATGVLPLVLGRATRLARFLTSDRKRYEAIVQLGQATDTYDRQGAPVGERVPVTIGRDAIVAALDRFRGDISQVPPPYSAKKIGGVSAHRLARRGQAVTPAAVQVTVHDLALLDATDDRVTLEVLASAGFYVRSLAHDLGATLGCGAHLTALRRTASGEWTLADAVPFALCEDDPDGVRDRIIPMARLLTGWPSVVVTADGERRLGHGQLLRPQDVRWLTAPAESDEEGETPRGVSRDDDVHGAPGRLRPDGQHPPLPLPSGTSQGRGRGGQGGEGEGPFVRVLDSGGDLLAVATPRPDGLLHPGLVLV